MYYTESPVFATLQGSKPIHPGIHGSPSRAEEITGSPHQRPIKVVVWNTDCLGDFRGQNPGPCLGYIGDYKYTTPLKYGGIIS